MNGSWRNLARCRGVDPEIFHPDLSALYVTHSIVSEPDRAVNGRAEHEEILKAIIARHSIMRQWHQFSLIPKLEGLGLFEREGDLLVEPVTVTQSVDDYIESFHGRSSLARHRIGQGAADAFDREVRALLGDRTTVERSVAGRIVYGRPVAK